MFGIVSSDVIRPIQGLREKQVFIKFLTILPNCSVGVTVIVAKFVNSSIYFFVFFLLFMLYVRLVHSWTFRMSHDIWKY